MAALAANAVKSQRRKAANKLAEQALSNINEQRQFLATVAQKHRDSLSSVSTLDSYRQYEDPNKAPGGPRPARPRRSGPPEQDRRKKAKLDKSDNEDGVYVASGSANIILYVGLGMICIGLVITFVGLGDKGFRTLELKLIGPSLVGCGVFFALLRVLFCTVPSCCRACCKCCGKTEDKEELIYATDDPPPKTGYVVSNNSNMSAGTHPGNKRVGPTDSAASGNGGRSSTHHPRQKSGKAVSDKSEESETADGEFKNKTIKSSSLQDSKNASNGSGGAKPISYDTYSTDTSSQFSVDIVEVTPTSQNMELKEQIINETNGKEIVLNASRLQVESEK